MAEFQCGTCGFVKSGVDPKHVGTSTKCPKCKQAGEVVESEQPQSFRLHKPESVPWRDDNWGIAGIVMAFFSLGFIFSCMQGMLSFGVGAAFASLVCAVCSKSNAVGAVAITVGLLDLLLAFGSASLAGS